MSGESSIGAISVQLEANLQPYAASLNRGAVVTSQFATNTSRQIKVIEGSFTRLGNSVRGALSSFVVGAAGGALASIGIEKIASAIRSVVAEGAGLVDTANKVGMTTESLQELHLAATQGGASIEQMDKALGFFGKSIGEAAQGGGELAKVLEANGVAIRDGNGHVRSAIDLLKDYADLIKRAGSEQERARLTAIAFGRSGDDLANVFRDGAAGIDAAASAAHRLGAVIDDATLQKIAALDDRWDAFATTLATRTKSAILETVSWLDTLGGELQSLGTKLDQFQQEQAGKALSPGAQVGDLVGRPNDPMAAAKAGAAAQLRAGLAAGSPSWTGRADWFGTAKTTVLPSEKDTSARDRAADRAKREQAAIAKLIETLKEENALVGASEADKAVAANLRHAGAAATAEQRDEIEKLTRSLVASESAFDKAKAAAADLKDSTKDLLGGLATDLRNGASAADALGNAFDKIADKLISMAINQLVEHAFGGLTTGGGVTATASRAAAAIAAQVSDTIPQGKEPVVTRRDLPPPSGNVLGFAKSYVGGVNSQLTQALKTAAERFPLKVEAYSGYRAGDPRLHGQGLATDVRIFDKAGKVIPNYQSGPGFRTYEQYAQQVYGAAGEVDPKLQSQLRWGGYFSGKAGHYGAADAMHFDLGGRRGLGMGGGSWQDGLNSQQQGYFPDAESTGLKDSMTSLKAATDQAASSAEGFGSGLGDLAKTVDSSSGAIGSALTKSAGTISASAGGISQAGGVLESSATALSGKTAGAFETLLSGLGKGIDGLLSGLGNIVQSIGGSAGGGLGTLLAGLLPVAAGGVFAGGGVVRGPGSGTSDSINARLSNGEFVTNAKSTRAFLPLLTAINDNDVPHFSDGGLFNSAMGPRFATGGMVKAASGVQAAAGGGGAPNINIIDRNDNQISKRERRNSDGTTDIDVFLDAKIAEKLATPGTRTNKVAKGNFGVRQGLRRT